MSESLNVPEHMKEHIDQFYDELCNVLTSWEQGEISDFELYSFMVDVANKITQISYVDEVSI